MSTLELLVQEARNAPESIVAEALHYLRYLKEHQRDDDPENRMAALVSEPALARDWLIPEEEAAWAHLSEAM